MTKNAGFSITDQGARSIGEDDIALYLSPVALIPPAGGLVAVPKSGPAGELLVHLIVDVAEGTLGRASAMIIGPAPDNGVEV